MSGKMQDKNQETLKNWKSGSPAKLTDLSRPTLVLHFLLRHSWRNA